MPYEFIERWWLVMFIAFCVLMYAFAYSGYLVQEDAKKRGLGKPAVTFWSFTVVFFGPIFLPLYLMFRARAVFASIEGDKIETRPFRLCPHCGEENEEKAGVCRKCHKRIDSAEQAGGKKDCPYCGAMNPVESTRCAACDQVIGYIEDDDEE